MKHPFRTRTGVHTPAAAQSQRERSLTDAQRALGGLMLFAQMLLWVTFFGYDRARQAVWQAALMELLPLLLLYFVWRRRDEGRHPLFLWPLLFCLLVDTALSLLALSGLIGQLIPHYPAWVGVLAPCGFAFLTVEWSGLRGTGYGAWLLRGLMLVFFIFGTVFLRASNRGDRLFPLLGRGMENTLRCALHGTGSVWGVALLFALPKGTDPKHAARFTFVPWALGVIWALWYGFIRPWGEGDEMAVAEKLMGLARHAGSVTLYEMAGLLWMTLLPLSMTGSAACVQAIVRRTYPRVPRFVPVLLVLAIPAAALLADASRCMAVLETLLPLRTAASLLTGLMLMQKGGRA